MRFLIPFTTAFFFIFSFVRAEQRFLAWSSKAAALTIPEERSIKFSNFEHQGLQHIYLIEGSDEEDIILSNQSKQPIKVRLFWLNGKKASEWINLAPGAELLPTNIFADISSVNTEQDRWDAVTTFLAECKASEVDDPEERARQQYERIRAKEAGTVKNYDGITFNKPVWISVNADQLDIEWSSRYPIESVVVKNLTLGNVILDVEGLNFYRLHFGALDREVKKQLIEGQNYELTVAVTDKAGKRQEASTRFMINKALTFDPFVSSNFSKDQLKLRWSSQYLITEVSFLNKNLGDTLYNSSDVEELKKLKKFELNGQVTYQLDQELLAAKSNLLKRGDSYELIVSISDSDGVKRIFAKPFYCMSIEETLLFIFLNDDEAYSSLMSFVEGTQELRTTKPSISSSPSRSSDIAKNPEENEPGLKESGLSVVDETINKQPDSTTLPEAPIVEEAMPMPDETPESSSIPEEITEQTIRGGGKDLEVMPDVFAPSTEKLIFSKTFDTDEESSNSSSNIRVISSNLTTNRKGEENSAYSFDGVEDYLMINLEDNFTIDNNTPYTLALWIKTENNNSPIVQLFSKQENEGSFLFNLQLKSGQPVLETCSYNISCETLYSSKIELNNWHHVAFVMDEDSTLKIFIDGNLIRERIISLQAISPQAPTLLFGKNTTGKEFFQGKLDDIYFYKRALSGEEIRNFVK